MKFVNLTHNYAKKDLFRSWQNWLGLIAACVSPEIINLSLPILNTQNLPFGYKMNLFKNLPTSEQQNFNEDGFEGEKDYHDPVELLGSRKKEFIDDKFKNFVINTLDKGASLIGGCCEVKPRHINLLKNIF